MIETNINEVKNVLTASNTLERLNTSLLATFQSNILIGIIQPIK